MTTETMREAVARAIADAGGFDWESEFVRVVATKYADAAIRTVLERLREPGDDVLTQYGEQFKPLVTGIWQAMLDAAAREALPESADSGRG